MDILSDVKITGNITIDRLDNGYDGGGFMIQTTDNQEGITIKNKEETNKINIAPGRIDLRLKRFDGTMMELCSNEVFGKISSLTIPTNCSKFHITDYCIYTDDGKIEDITDLVFPNITAWDASTLKKVEIDYELKFESDIESIFGKLSNNVEEKTIVFAINPTFKSF